MDKIFEKIMESLGLAYALLAGAFGAIFAAGKITERLQSRQKFVPRKDCENFTESMLTRFKAIDTRFDALDYQAAQMVGTLDTVVCAVQKIEKHVDKVKKGDISPVDDETGF